MRQQQLIDKAIGPAPWYWESFPEPTGASGRRYIWTYHREQGPIGYLVTLSPRQDPQSTVLALNTYARAFLVPPHGVGIWCPEYSPSGGGSYLRVMCFDPDQLPPFPLTEVAGWFKQSSDRVYSKAAPLAEFEIPILAAGRHRIEVPPRFHGIEGEMFLIHSSTGHKEAMQDILVLSPSSGELEVLPQNWLSGDKYDHGYQWITRVTRDPVSGRLIGDGIRIGRFELTEDGRQLAHWIE